VALPGARATRYPITAVPMHDNRIASVGALKPVIPGFWRKCPVPALTACCKLNQIPSWEESGSAHIHT